MVCCSILPVTVFYMDNRVSVHIALILTGIYTGEFFYILHLALIYRAKFYFNLTCNIFIFKVANSLYKVNDLRIYRLFIFLLYCLYVLL